VRGRPFVERLWYAANANTSTTRAPKRMPTSPTISRSTSTSTKLKRTAAAKTAPRLRSQFAAAGAISLCGKPARSETVTKRKPRARSDGISRFSAATVCVRLPPPSCNITIPPVLPGGLAARTIFATPGRCQSFES
jgi:hypothetical protein